MKCIFNQNGICARLNMPVVEKCNCPLRKTDYEVCAFCGQPIYEGGIWDSDLLYCNNCGRQLQQCGTCANASQCLFETDPSPLPKTVMQTVKNGNMTSTFSVKNPSRIDITCKKGCACFNEKNGCCRDFHTCAGWILKRK